MKVLTKEEFVQLTAQPGYTLVDFYADWCGPCKMLGPILEEIGEEMPEIRMGKLNVDDNEDIAIQYQVMSIPLVCLFKDGRLIGKSLGYKPKEDMVDWIQGCK
ncbi:MAG: thioredoxin [Erysipelotrichaceae bacterium]|nr:thioredoxin [Erysipelotrichaceae bacterium]